MNRQGRRSAFAKGNDAERRAPFREGALPYASSEGWLGSVDQTWQNGWFSVLCRTLRRRDGRTMLHLAIHNLADLDVTWADKMWIKDTLAGPERVAVEVFPARSALVDGANLYHLFVLNPGETLGFGLRPEDCT